MAWDKTPWAPPLVELEVGIAGHLLAWERHERDGSWWAWVSWIHESGGRRRDPYVTEAHAWPTGCWRRSTGRPSGCSAAWTPASSTTRRGRGWPWAWKSSWSGKQTSSMSPPGS